MSILRKLNVVLCENIVVLFWMSVICVMVVLEPFNSQWNVFPLPLKKKKKIPFLKERFSACVMIHCTFCAVHSGAVDSKGHQGVLLGKRWFLSLPREQSNSSGCHFRASWNNLQFIAAVVIALNWSWNGEKKMVSWAINGNCICFLDHSWISSSTGNESSSQPKWQNMFVYMLRFGLPWWNGAKVEYRELLL